MEIRRFEEIEREIAETRESLPECETADAIDRNDGWEDIAENARRNGYDDLAELCNDAAAEWRDENRQ